jgi:flagellar biosynthesis/type III secretory pathway M-ring protein FliF/YscJ
LKGPTVNYPLLDAFLTMMWIFIWVLWFFLLFKVILDIFRSHDMGGWGKAGWLIFVIILPYLGVFVYLIARGRKMAEHDARAVQDRQDMFNEQVRAAAGSGSTPADQLSKLADLHAKGLLSDEEFAAQKAKILA